MSGVGWVPAGSRMGVRSGSRAAPLGGGSGPSRLRLAGPEPVPGAAPLAEPAPGLRLPWWCTPPGVALGFVVPVVLIVAAAGAAELPNLTVRGLRFVTPQFLALAAGLMLVMAIGGWLGGQIKLPGRDRSGERDWEFAAFWVGLVAATAYLFWFRGFLLDPGMLFATLTGAHEPDKASIALTPGLTSLANIAPVFFSVYAYRLLLGDRSTIETRTHVLAVALLALTVFRVYVWTERLAMIEMAVPFGLAAGGMLMRARGGFARVLRLGGPYLALPLVILFFGASEYFRAWSADTYHGKSGFWAFAIGRFASYYYTALNNGAGLVATVDYPTWKFEFVLGWLHSIPLPLAGGFTALVGGPGNELPEFMALYGDPEFNSPTGLFSAVVDLGLPGALVYLFVVGGVSGFCFRAYQQARVLGVLAYPIFFITYLEILRYVYLGEPRAFTWVVGIGLVTVLARARATAVS